MKRITVSLRVDIEKNYNERRDALDQRWTEFLLKAGLWPVFVPNNMSYVQKLLENEQVDGVLLTGGSSLIEYGGNSAERDEAEQYLLKWAISNKKPVLGVCRGMQVIQKHYNNQLIEVSGHVGNRHKLKITNEGRIVKQLKLIDDVNGYHNYGALGVKGELIKIAESFDGVVQAVEHENDLVFGIMWHSEREVFFRNAELNLFKTIFSM
jgi:putative glutamine amidotransferase